MNTPAIEYASEAHDISAVWDATVLFLMTGAPSARIVLNNLLTRWVARHPTHGCEMEEEA